MAEEKWLKVREIFDSALQQKPDERRGFVNDVCGGDKTLLAEIESLLSSLDGAESFMETPAVAKVAGAFEAEAKVLEKGKCFGHYEIIEQIGAGGMGEVYLAQDKKLDRKVAVKILNERFSRDESNLQRFIREAKSASGLNHPNILVIHEIGESGDAHYIVSEHIKGKTLRAIFNEKTLKLSEVFDIAIQSAGALCAAHEAHLIHRDIKPENIMIRPDGFVKILDFGLAKLVEQQAIGLEKATAKQNETAKGVILGTINYMSPEQAKGERVDERTDIFSLGVLIYEMLAGRTPFTGDSVSETFANLINQEPQPLARFAANVPDELQRIVSKMIGKNKNERFQTMRDVVTDLKDLRENLSLNEKLERVASSGTQATAVLPATTGDANILTAETQYSFSLAVKRHKPLAALASAVLLISALALSYYFYAAKNTPVGNKKSIAVLPLKSINTASRDEIYEVGIADSLIYRLASIKGFIVRPLSAIRKYTDIEQDPLAAGREQQVDYVLASNYQIAGGKIRVTSQLFNVESGQIEETYKGEKDTNDVFAMQDAVADEFGKLLQSHFALTSGTPSAKRGTENEEAYRLYLQGLYFNDKRTEPDALKAIEAFEQAVRLDPNYARAWAGIATARRSIANGLAPASNFGRDTVIHEQHRISMEAVNKALELDPNLSEAYSALCENKLNYEYDFAAAETACKRAIELDPNSPLAHTTYARFLFGPGRRFDDAIAEIKTAIDLDPTSLLPQIVYTVCLTYARRYDEAARQLERLAQRNPKGAVVHFWLVGGGAMPGNDAEAFERLKRFQILAGTNEETIRIFKTAYQAAGWQGVLREQAKISDNYNSALFLRACIYAQIGDKKKAFEYLEKAYERREHWMAYLQTDPRLDPLRDDPRFDEMVKCVGILQ